MPSFDIVFDPAKRFALAAMLDGSFGGTPRFCSVEKATTAQINMKLRIPVRMCVKIGLCRETELFLTHTTALVFLLWLTRRV